MRTGTKGTKLIKEFESLHDGDLRKIGLQPKMDAVGIWTEGWGRAMKGKDGKFLRGAANKSLAERSATIHTIEQANAALEHDLKVREKEVLRNLKISLTQNQFDALVSHYYNTGGSDTLFDLINKKAGKAAVYKWWTEKYITSGGVKLRGLIRRRKAEADLYFSLN